MANFAPETITLLMEFVTLRRMLTPIPGNTLLLDQLDKVIAALENRDRVLLQRLGVHIDDAVLDIKAMEHDLEATRRERNTLQQQLDQE